MELTNRDIADLEAYWAGTLDAAARQALEARLRDHAAFRDEAERMRAAVAALDAGRDQAVLERLRRLEATLPPVPADRPLGSYRRPAWLAAAAALVLLVWLGWRWLGPRPAPADPYAQYFQPYPDLYTTMGSDSPTEAFEPYNHGNYPAAATSLGALFAASNDSLVLFYQAVAQLGAGQPDRAIPTLTALQGSRAAPADAVHWYLALAYLRAGNAAAARPLLLQLTASGEPAYRQRAAELVGQLR